MKYFVNFNYNSKFCMKVIVKNLNMNEKSETVDDIIQRY